MNTEQAMMDKTLQLKSLTEVGAIMFLKCYSNMKN